MKKNKINLIILVFYTALISLNVFAHGIDDGEVNLYQYYSNLSLSVIYVMSFIILFLAGISVFYEKKIKKYKKIIYVTIVLCVIIATTFLVWSTLYVNVKSITKGPVHWHADFEIYKCGEFVELKDPEGLSNREGSATFHEHNDNRIHVEGVVADESDVDLHNFFKTIGGELSKENLIAPTNHGLIELRSNDICNGKKAKLQVFLYKVINADTTKTTGFIYEQEKLIDFESYVLSPYGDVPPGDCLIIELDEEKEKTEHVCETYKLAIGKGDLVGS